MSEPARFVTLTDEEFTLVGGRLAVTEDGESYTHALTRIRAELLAAGRHPLWGSMLRASDETCGSCAFFRAHRLSRVFFKCALYGESHSAKTDIRKGWPACSQWEKPE